MADFDFVQRIRRAFTGKSRSKSSFNHGYSMGDSFLGKGRYDNKASFIRLGVIKVEHDLRNYFAETLEGSVYKDVDDSSKEYIASMVDKRIQHFKIDKWAKKAEKHSNEKNLNKWVEEINKVYRIMET